MPGMAASPSIFEGLALDTHLFELHRLDWFVPSKKMSIQDYALAMSKQIRHQNCVLLGVSFGGMLVQEMAKHIDAKKVIAVSCPKTKAELPRRMRFARATKVHRLLPTSLVNNIDLLAKYAFGESVNKRLDLYQKYLGLRDKHYINWAIDTIVNWDQTVPPKNLVHIHGEKDTVFPMGNIKGCIAVKNGTHTMILHRARWFNEHLPSIILGAAE